jgi:serine phosphatase RsbU (regulator of sigma subunit)
MKKVMFLCVVIVFIFCSSNSNAQTSAIIDSLLRVLHSSKEDTSHVNVLNQIAQQYLSTSNNELALKYSLQAQQLAESAKRLNDGNKEVILRKGLAQAYNDIGRVYMNLGDFVKSLDYFNMSLKIRNELGDEKGIANSYNNIALIYNNQGNYQKALEYHQKSFEIRQRIKDKYGMSMSYNNMGVVYNNIGNYEKALENHLRSLGLMEELNDKTGLARSYNNIGIIYERRGDTVNALNNYMKYLKISEETNNKQGIAYAYNNIGNIYMGKREFAKALTNQLNSLKLKEEIGDKAGIAMSYSNIGVIYERQNDNKKALENQLKSLKISEAIGDTQQMAIASNNAGNISSKMEKYDDAYRYNEQSLQWCKKIKFKLGIKDASLALADIYTKMGDYKKAYESQKLYVEMKDSLLNEQSSKQMAEMNIKYDSEKKDKELVKKDAEITRQQAEAEKRKLQRNSFMVGFILVLLLVFFVYRGYRQKRAINFQLAEKNELIENQKQLVEERNEKITDSINYAKRIQQAILPTQELIKSAFGESFILFKPKDIVSGDFYWMHAINEHQFLFAAADCTGHGVPGALMSMMGYNLLEQTVKEQHIEEPSQILNELSNSVTNVLKQTAELEAVKDGMDIALCKIDLRSYELEFSGAHNPLYLIRNGALTELKANRRSVGISSATPFTSQKIKIEKGDCIYLFSDGFVDQKGGPENKKFFYKPFQELLLSIHSLSMEEQHSILLSTTLSWRGNNEQMDDVLVAGIKI